MERMREILLGSPRLFVDETRAPVLDPGRGRTKTGYFWSIARDDRAWRAAPARRPSFIPMHQGAAPSMPGRCSPAIAASAMRRICGLQTVGSSRACGQCRDLGLLLGTLAAAVLRNRQRWRSPDRRRSTPAHRRALPDRSANPRQQRRGAASGAPGRKQARRRGSQDLARSRARARLAKSAIAVAIRYGFNHWEGRVAFSRTAGSRSTSISSSVR